MRRWQQRIAFLGLGLAAGAVFSALGAILFLMARHGLPALSWEFLTTFPRQGMTQGGIFPALVGTFYLVLGTVVVSLPLGVGAAIYLAEYAQQGAWTRLVQVGVGNLAGVPSIVFGLFGLAFFVKALGLGVSLLSGALTLGLLVLPVVIRAAEEALRAVPWEFREGAYALGATRWQAVRTVVLPMARPGIITGVILAVGRAAGETAPIMFTAAAYYTPRLPSSPLDEVMALPYHLFVLATESTAFWRTRHLQYGTALVLLALVLLFYIPAACWRARTRRRKRW
ncbi:TPA: phosphate ABC transporter permease PstA [Candidatus Bipolaricaulota bacterium]|nr:phosphate ABC transporter permease PstA [Candidatus Bipolaricaulota bacterium]HIP99896.1 phosphate ABC transporter permease PstA [Candidatus Bipolaricaulota bacterium]